MNSIQIKEVGPRDGLQNESIILSTEIKRNYILKLIESGINWIETTSFVRPDRIPQMADSKELSEGLDRNQRVQYVALVPNEKGLQSAIENKYKEIALFTAASETFSKKNTNSSLDESFQNMKKVSTIAREQGIKLRGYVSTVVACPYEGNISPNQVERAVDVLLESGCYEISLGDTIGVATPRDIKTLLEFLLKKYHKPELFAGHYHDTYGMGLANVQASLDLGIKTFDSSSGGLGGCPYANGASGNLATEDLVFFLEKSGYETGINLDRLVLASAYIETHLGRSLNSKTYLAKTKKKQEGP
jgi:hydroxymethylglutaryl-CoA lyase